jgi:RHS repeat-associated protein
VTATDPAGATSATTFSWDDTALLAKLLAVTAASSTTDLVTGGDGLAFASRSAGPAGVVLDALGSVTSTPATAGIAAHTSFDPFGVAASAGDSVTLGYRGELHIGEQIYLRGREYTPALGRFGTRDELDGTAGDTVVGNAYHYAANDPINSTDPSGLSPDITDKIIKAGGPGLGAAALTAEACATEIAKGGDAKGPRGGTSVTLLQLTCTPEALGAVATGVLTAAAVAGTNQIMNGHPSRPKAGKNLSQTKKQRPKLGRAGDNDNDGALIRVQAQWNTYGKQGPEYYDSEMLPATAQSGVTTLQTITAIEQLWRRMPTRARKAAQSAKDAAIARVRERPAAGGVYPGAKPDTYYFVYDKNIGARIDIEYLRGHNLRI